MPPFDPRDKFANQAASPVSNTSHQPGYSGNNNAAEYVASGMPFSEAITAPSGSQAKVSFPFVTNEIYLTNTSGVDARFGWTALGLDGTNYHTLQAGESMTLRIRTKCMFFTSTGADAPVDVSAALTLIPYISFPTLTGSWAHPVTGLPTYYTGSITGEFGYDGLG